MRYSDLQAAVGTFRAHPRRYAYPVKNAERSGQANEPGQPYGDFSAATQTALEQAKEADALTNEQKRDWLIKNGLDGGGRLSSAVQAAVYRRVYQDVLPMTWAPDFFEEANLKNDEWPALDLRQLETTYEVKTIGPDGGKPKSRKVGRRAELTQFLEFLQTERVRYRLMDIMTGDVAAVEDIVRGLDISWAATKHEMALTLIKAAKITSGMNAMPYMRLHRLVDSNNVPAKNYYDFSSGGLNLPNSGYITVEKLKRIFQHCAQLQNATIDQEVPVKIKTLYISPQNKRDFWDMSGLVGTFGGTVTGITLDGTDITKPKDVLPADVKAQIFKTGELKQFYGEDFELKMSNTIAAGYWYASMNLPLGVWFWKPGMKQVSKNDDDETMAMNEGEIGFGTPQVLTMPTQWQYRTVFGKW